MDKNSSIWQTPCSLSFFLSFKSLFLNIFRNNPGLPNVTEQDDNFVTIQFMVIDTHVYIYNCIVL